MVEGRPRGRVAVAIGATISFGLGTAFFLVVAFSEHRGQPLIGSIAVGAVYAMPGALAVLGYRRRRPGLVLAAAFVALPLGIYLLSVIVFVLLISCVCFNVAYVQMGASGSRWRDVVAAIAVTVLTVASIPVLFLRQDPRCWAVMRREGVERTIAIGPAVGPNGEIRLDSRPGEVGSGCTSDVVTTFEGLAALGALTLALGVGWALTTRDDRWDRGSDDRLEAARGSAAPFMIRRA